MDLGARIACWPAARTAVMVVAGDGEVVARHGDPDEVFPLASVTKLLTAWAVLVAVEEETIGLDQAAGPDGATVRHLLAHASGLGPDGDVLARAGTRRIYSNAGYDLLADTVAAASGLTFERYLTDAVLEPLAMGATRLDGSAAAGASSSAADLARFAAELLDPQILAPATAEAAVTPAFADLPGVLPGFGRHDPNPWGLGPEVRGDKTPHWTGTTHSPATFGHFGQQGSFVCVDPTRAAACVVLTDEPFGPWAVDAWPAFNDHVLEGLG